MKCIVTAPFRDKYDPDIRYQVGDSLEWDDKARIEDCVNQGLIMVIKEEKPKKTTTTKKTQK